MIRNCYMTVTERMERLGTYPTEGIDEVYVATVFLVIFLYKFAKLGMVTAAECGKRNYGCTGVHFADHIKKLSVFVDVFFS